MTEESNATLEEFAGSATENAGDQPGDAGGEDHATDGSVPPATTTYRWAPAGRSCDACERTATVLWRDGVGLVCPECKGWESGG